MRQKPIWHTVSLNKPGKATGFGGIAPDQGLLAGVRRVTACVAFSAVQQIN